MRKTQHNGTGAVDGLPLVELSVHAGRYMQLTVGIEFHLTQGTRQTTIGLIRKILTLKPLYLEI